MHTLLKTAEKSMKLYTYDRAPNPQRLALFMKYKGIEIETEQVDLMAAEQFSDEYRALVPDCTVPALVLDDGSLLSEVIGICSYLEGLYPEKPLFGQTDLERAHVISWDHKLFLFAFMPVAEALRNGSPNFANRALPGPAEVEQIPALAERGMKRLDYAWSELNKILGDKTWLAGDFFSLADIDMAVCEGFSAWVKGSPSEEYATLHDYLARVKAELA